MLNFNVAKRLLKVILNILDEFLTFGLETVIGRSIEHQSLNLLLQFHYSALLLRVDDLILLGD